MAFGFGNIGFVGLQQPGGFTIPVLAQNSAIPANVDRFFGNFPINVQTTATVLQITILRDCRLVACVVECQSFAAVGTAEAWPMFVRVNNTTDNLISTVAVANARRTWSNMSMSVLLSAGDRVVIKSSSPAFVTAPGSNVLSGYMFFLNR